MKKAKNILFGTALQKKLSENSSKIQHLLNTELVVVGVVTTVVVAVVVLAGVLEEEELTQKGDERAAMVELGLWV